VVINDSWAKSGMDIRAGGRVAKIGGLLTENEIDKRL